MQNPLIQKLESLVDISQKPLETFSDVRMSGLQFLFDFALSKGKSQRNLNTLDLTEFFRLGESFAKGYELAQEIINPVIDVEIKEMEDFASTFFGALSLYEGVLRDNINDKSRYDIVIETFSKDIDSNALDLLNGNYMKSNRTPRFDDEKVIITGSDNGLGRGIALEFARRGAKVALHYPLDKFSRGANSAVDLITESGGEAKAFQGDFRTQKGVDEFWKKAFDYLGGIDVLVNNAGITMSRGLENVTEEQYDTVYDVNVKAMHRLTQNVAPHMKEQKEGAIINMSSICGFLGLAEFSVYCGTKGAITSMTRALAMNFAPFNVRVNAIAPDGVSMPNAFKLNPRYNSRGKSFPLDYFINPEDVAYLATFLASEDAKCITGQTILIDCGSSSGLKDGISATKTMGMSYGKGYVSGIE